MILFYNLTSYNVIGLFVVSVFTFKNPNHFHNISNSEIYSICGFPYFCWCVVCVCPARAPNDKMTRDGHNHDIYVVLYNPDSVYDY